MCLNIKNRTVYCNDNLNILRGINNNCIDLIYLDPPFNSGKEYTGARASMAELAKFKDSWDENDENIEWWFQIKEKHPKLYLYLKDVDDYANKSTQVYLTMMAVRMLEMHRVLKDTGSLYYHCDQSAGHYIKVMLDIIFGMDNFKNEIIWSYKSGGAGKTKFAKKHDTLLFYTKSKKYTFNLQKQKSYISGELGLKATQHLLNKDEKGWSTFVNQRDVWQIDIVGRSSRERTGYPTQKPLTLLEAIIRASSNKGDMVLDPFCGCATTCVAAEKLERQWVGIDVWEDAHNLIQKRLFIDFDLWEGGLIHHLTRPPTRTGADPKNKPIRKRRYIPDEVKEKVWERDGGECTTCGAKEELQYDHIIPFSEGGGDGIANLQILCRKCNLEKSNKYHS